MPKDIIMYQWNVRVVCLENQGYKEKYRKVETEVIVIARNRKEAAELAIEAAKEKDMAFIFGDIQKIRRRDIKKYGTKNVS